MQAHDRADGGLFEPRRLHSEFVPTNTRTL